MLDKELVPHPDPISVVMVSARADVGGGPIHILRLMNGLNELSRFRLAVAIPANQELSRELKDQGQDLIEMPVRSLSLKSLMHLIRYCNENHVDIIHSHGFGAGIYSRIAKIFTHAKVVHTYHGLKQPKSFKDWFKLGLEWLLSNRTDSAICVSSSEREVATHLHLRPRSMRVIHHAIAESFFLKHTPAVKYNDTILIGTICRIDDSQKNLSTIISALALLPKNYELLIAGSGPDREKLIAQAAFLGLDKRCQFIGHVGSSSDFLKTLDIFVSASRHEGLPASVLEAVALDVKCVLSNIPPHREIGIDLHVPLFKFDDVKSLAKLLMDPDLIPTPHESAAFTLFRDKFNLPGMVSRTADMYEGLAINRDRLKLGL